MNLEEILNLNEKDFKDCPMWVVGALRDLALRQQKLEKAFEAAKNLSMNVMMTWYGECTPDQLRESDFKFREARAYLEEK